MTLSAFVFTYILGGLTFIPLVLAAIFVSAWLLLPPVGEASKSRQQDGGEVDGPDSKEKDVRNEVPVDTYASEGAASATFAVLRRYDFQAANAALSVKNGSGNAAGGSTTADGAAETSGGNSKSVYQSMYQSVFDRSKNQAAGNSVLDTSESQVDGENGKVKKITTPVNIFYIELRHGHLMLYDSQARREPRHVISLAHHAVSLSAGTTQADEETDMKDGELFIRRTAIVLTPTELPNGGLQSRSVAPQPFVLFSATCIEKEDFYHALLQAKMHPPVPEPLDTDDMIKLLSALQSASITPETKAINAFVSRIFFAMYHTDGMKDFIQKKIEKKISRVQKPAFIASLAVQAIDLGDAAPIISNLRLKDLSVSGDTTVAFDVKYTGGMSITIAALAKLDLGARFKTRTVDLVLASSIQRFQGRMLVRIKPPPSNRFWFCFEQMPDMEIKIEPVVSQRQITYTFILRAIEERIRAVVGETLVKPNWDDIAFFDTRGQPVRGGIWRKMGDSTSEYEHAASEALKASHKKSMSMPDISGLDADSSANSSGSEATAQVASASSSSTTGPNAKDNLKRRSVASLPPSSTTPPAGTGRELARPPKPLRSPSITTPSASAPSIALDEASVNYKPSRADDARPSTQRSKTWRMRPAPQAPKARREAVEAVREMRDRSMISSETEAEALVAAEAAAAELSADEDAKTGNRRTSDTAYLKSTKRTDTNNSSASSATSQTQQQQRKATILAATAAATTAARNWSWNAIQTARTKGTPPQGVHQQAGARQQAPIGRGQPLPPPGMPLPGPQKGLFTGMASIRRKPVLPSRRTGGVESAGSSEEALGVSTDQAKEQGELETLPSHDEPDVTTPTSEFGPWRQNSGLEADAHGFISDPTHSSEGEGETVAVNEGSSLGIGGPGLVEETGDSEVQEHTKHPPPLPPRRAAIPPSTDEQGRSETSESTIPETHLDKAKDPALVAEPPNVVDGERTRYIEDLSRHNQDNAFAGEESLSDLVAIPAPLIGQHDDDIEAEGDEARHHVRD